MRLPYLQEIQNHSKKYIVAFRGIQYGEGWQEGELRESRNLSSGKYPCLGQRAQRIQAGSYPGATAVHAKEGLLMIQGTDVLYKGQVVGSVTEGRKQIATVGNIICIFPDKVYYRTDTEVFGRMDAEYTAAGLKFTKNTITTTGEDWPFRVGDAVEISGCSTAENNQTIIVRGVDGKVLTFYDESFTEATESGSVTIKRNIPDLEYICESNYRLWGVAGNTIYGSKYSDPLNFQSFDGLTGDSYYIDVGTDGPFTGCIPYGSHICFFKENSVCKLYGSKPSNYQIVHSNVYGVQEGCERSMCIVNETLLYKGVHGVYAYTGGIPELISDCFGPRRYAEAAAACDGEIYYISMRTGDSWGLWAYDVLKGIWLQEDDTHAVDLAAYDGYVWLLDDAGDLWQIDRLGDVGDMEWTAEFCPFNETVNERKGYSKFHLRLDLAAGAWLAIDYKTENDEAWETAYTGQNEQAKTLSVPIIPTRCDSVSIRLRGKGECTVRTFIREFFTGSDR